MLLWAALVAAAAMMMVVATGDRGPTGQRLSSPLAVRAGELRLRQQACTFVLRGGQGEVAEAPGGAALPGRLHVDDVLGINTLDRTHSNDTESGDDEDWCDWLKMPKPGCDDGPVPRLDTEHAPWLDPYRQVYFEEKLHNRSLVRAYEAGGFPPPPCVRTVGVCDDRLLVYDFGAENQPMCENWEQYWAEWEQEWAEPPDCATDIGQQRYKMPYLTDTPPIIGLSRISVAEKPIFACRVFPDSVPAGWPFALHDVLHDEYDEATRVMALNGALLEAANCGDIERAVQLLREGALVHAGDSNNQYMTPLHHAAYEGHVELAQVLVGEEGAEVDRTTLGGETALHKAVQGLGYRVWQGNGSGVFQPLAAHDTEPVMVQALLRLGADPNARSGLAGCPRGEQPGMGWTPLFRAALLGLTDVVKMLVAAGADVNVQSTVGWTALHYAATWGHNETVDALLDAGADPLLRSKHGGHTAYDRAMMSRFSVDTPLRPMRQLCASVLEKLHVAMQRALNGREPLISVPDHWRHGNKMPQEVLTAHRQKWARFYNGDWVREWRRVNGHEYEPTRDELMEVMQPWLQKYGYPVPRLQALRGGRSGLRPLQLRGGDGDGIQSAGGVEMGIKMPEHSEPLEEGDRGSGKDVLMASELRAQAVVEGVVGAGELSAGGRSLRVLGAQLAQARLVVVSRGETTEVLQRVLGMQVLRHEEMDVGAASLLQQANEDRMWSRSSFGYGAEADGFLAIETIYHYPTRSDLRHQLQHPPMKRCEMPSDKDWRMTLHIHSPQVYRHVIGSLDGLGGAPWLVESSACGDGVAEEREGMVSVHEESSAANGAWVLVQAAPGFLIRVFNMERESHVASNTSPRHGDDEMDRALFDCAEDAGLLADGERRRCGRERGLILDPISNVEVPVDDVSGAARFWQFGMGLDLEGGRGTEGEGTAVSSACLRADSAHGLTLRQRKGRGTPGMDAKLGFMFPESWIAGIADVAKEEFGSELLTPLISMDSAGLGRVKLMEISAPGGSVVRLMSHEDMVLLSAAAGDEEAKAAAALLKDELAADDAETRLADEGARMQAESILRAAGRSVPGDRPAAGGDGGEEGADEEVETEVVRVEAAEEALVSLVWLHGSGLHSHVRHQHTDDVPEGWAHLTADMGLPCCRMILPTAPLRQLKFLSHALRPVWFDVELAGTMAEVCPLRRGSEDARQIRQAAAMLSDLVADEKDPDVASLGAPLVLGGFGPGAVVALWAVLAKGGARPDALVLCNAWAPSALMRPKNMSMLQGLPVLVLIGGVDPVVPVGEQRKLAATLHRLGFAVTVHESAGVSHTLDLGRQGPLLRDFLLRLVRQWLGGVEGEDVGARVQAMKQAQRKAEEKVSERAAAAEKKFQDTFGVALDSHGADGPLGGAMGSNVGGGQAGEEHVKVTFELHKSAMFAGQQVCCWCCMVQSALSGTFRAQA